MGIRILKATSDCTVQQSLRTTALVYPVFNSTYQPFLHSCVHVHAHTHLESKAFVHHRGRIECNQQILE